MPLFEVAIIQSPKLVKGEVEEQEKILAVPSTVLAKDSQSAAMKFVMERAEVLKGADHDRMQVLVRPFA